MHYSTTLMKSHRSMKTNITLHEAIQAVHNANAHAFFTSNPPCRDAYSRLLWECEIADLSVDDVVRLMRKRKVSKRRSNHQNNIFALLQSSENT